MKRDGTTSDAKVESTVAKPDVAKPDAAKPDVAKPDVAKPDAPKADVAKPDVPKPDAPKPDTTAAVGCVSPTAPMQVFTTGMYGCAGKVTYTNRATLCAAGYHVCSAAEWIARRGTIAPSASYWTSDDLKFNGGASSGCYASLTTGAACTTGRPMRVCMGPSDPQANTCQYFGCGFNAIAPSQFFGGCNNDPTAGAICCK